MVNVTKFSYACNNPGRQRSKRPIRLETQPICAKEKNIGRNLLKAFKNRCISMAISDNLAIDSYSSGALLIPWKKKKPWRIEQAPRLESNWKREKHCRTAYHRRIGKIIEPFQ
jgi:hypothetical protein